MSNSKITTRAATASRRSESERLRRIAAQHGLDVDAFERLISESRNEARNRRRRLPDARLEELVNELGAGQ